VKRSERREYPGISTNGKYKSPLAKIAYSLNSHVKLVQIEFGFEAAEKSGYLLNEKIV